jgi:hypothetical protein
MGVRDKGRSGAIGIEEGLDLRSGAEDQEGKPIVGAARLLLDQGLDLIVIEALGRQPSSGKLLEGPRDDAVEVRPASHVCPWRAIGSRLGRRS